MKEFGSQILHAVGGILFCTSCNVSLDHTRRSTVQRHLESKSHRSREYPTPHCWKMNTQKKIIISPLFEKSTESSENRQLVTMELVDTFASSKIPLEKLDHPKLRVFIQRNVQNGDCLPSANKL
ncbi:CGG triplet repeat-binding protein 1-like [Heterodontus francisci]|uniref:CGG triplet repeat-binding protein 1-like n=1 Tax=Heterodontus francisci TaxID=7792 RepID=UPI00355B23D8